MSTPQLSPQGREALARQERALDRILRAEARRQGMRLQKSRRRTPEAVEYGKYTLLWAEHNAVIADLMTVDDVDEFLSENRINRRTSVSHDRLCRADLERARA